MSIDYAIYYTKYLDEQWDYNNDKRWEFLDCLASVWSKSDQQCSMSELFYKNGLPELGIFNLTGFIYGQCRDIDYVVANFSDTDLQQWCQERGLDLMTVLAYKNAESYL